MTITDITRQAEAWRDLTMSPDLYGTPEWHAAFLLTNLARSSSSLADLEAWLADPEPLDCRQCLAVGAPAIAADRLRNMGGRQ